VNLETQVLTMLHMIAAGLYVGISTDTYMRIVAKPRFKIGQIVQDLFFWMVIAAVVFFWLQFVNDGELRVDIFFSLLLGFSAYKALLQRAYRHFLERCIHAVLVTVRFLKKCFYYLFIRPVQLLYRAVTVILVSVATLLLKIGQGLIRLVLFPFRPLLRLAASWWRHVNPFARSAEDGQEQESQQKNAQNAQNSPKKEGFWARIKNKWLRKR
jgi:spore cortex biosynthesis protein YabQ